MKKEALSKRVLNYLDQCCKSNNKEIRKGQATNPYLPVEFLEILAEDSSIEVLQNVASNPNSSIEILNKLVKNIDHLEKEQEKKREKSYQETGVKGNAIHGKKIIVAVIEHINVSVELLEHIREFAPGITHRGEQSQCKNYAEEKLKEIAESSETSVKTLHKLAKSNSNKVRQVVAQNPNISFDDLEILIWDYNEEVRKIAYNNNINNKKDSLILERETNEIETSNNDTYDYDDYYECAQVDHSYANLSGFNNPAEKADHLYGIPDPRLLED